MSAAATPRREPELADLPAVSAPLTYLAPGHGPVRTRVFPPNSGRPTERPPAVKHLVTIYDVRSRANLLRLDTHGFELHRQPSGFTNYYDESAVRERYYPEVRAALREITTALEVIVFDHNVRGAARAARGELGVRLPVDQVHNDYTECSGRTRKQEILDAAGRTDLADRRVAFVNLWRPIVGPVQDNPLALCDARSVARQDLVETEIQHFGEGNLDVPRHRGEIFSVRHNPLHQWHYVSDMHPSEFLLLKCYDSRNDGRARFTPHTGFQNPACPSDFVPRESIEARTLVVFDEPL